MDGYKSNITKLKKVELIDDHLKLMIDYDMLFNDYKDLKEEIEQQNSIIFMLQKRIKELESIIKNNDILFE